MFPSKSCRIAADRMCWTPVVCWVQPTAYTQAIVSSRPLQRTIVCASRPKSAGLMPQTPLDRLKIDEWERMIDVNIKGVLYAIAAALPHMKRQKAGHFINVSSVAGHKVGQGFAVYAATKYAVRALSEGLRQEVKPYNIRSTIISPGAVDTELPDSITEPDVAEGMHQFYKQYALPADSFARVVAFAISQPEDVDINEVLFRPTRQEL